MSSSSSSSMSTSSASKKQSQMKDINKGHTTKDHENAPEHAYIGIAKLDPEKNQETIRRALFAIPISVESIKMAQPGDEMEKKGDIAEIFAGIVTLDVVRHKIVSEGGINLMIDILLNGSNKAIQSAVVVIGTIACMDEPSRETIRANGGITPLLHLIHSPVPEISKWAQQSIESMSKDASCTREIVKASGVTSLLTYIKTIAQSCKFGAINCLFFMCKHEDQRVSQLVASEEGIPILMECMRNDCEYAAAAAFSVLAIMSATDSVLPQLLSAGVITKFGHILKLPLYASRLTSCKPHVEQAILRLALLPDMKQILAAAGVIPPLLEVVKSQSDMCGDTKPEKAIIALCSMAQEEQLCKVIFTVTSLQYFKPYLITVPGDKSNLQITIDTKMAIAGGLAASCKDDDFRKEVVNGGILRLLVHTFKGHLQAGNSGNGDRLQRIGASVVSICQRCTEKDLKLKIETTGAVALMLECVKIDGNPSLREDTLKCLLQLCTEIQLRAAIAQADGIKIIIRLHNNGVKTPGNVWSGLTYCMAILGELALDSVLAPHICSAGLVPVFCEIIKDKDNSLGRIGQHPWTAKVAKEKATRALYEICSHGPDEVKIVNKDGGIPVLIDVLKSGTITEKANAAGALSFLAMSPDLRQQIGHPASNVIKTLAEIISFKGNGKEAQEARFNAVIAIRNISYDDNMKKLTGSVGVIPVLLKIAKSGTVDERENAASVISQLATDKSLVKSILATGALSLFMDFTKNGSFSAKMCGISAIRYLSMGYNDIHEDNTKQSNTTSVLNGLCRQNPDLVNILLDLLRREIYSPSLGSLSNTAALNESCSGVLFNMSMDKYLRKQLAIAGGVDVMTRFLPIGASGTRDCISGALANISACHALRKEYITTSTVSALIQTAKVSSADGKSRIATAFGNLCADPLLLKHMLDNDVIHVLIEMGRNGSFAGREQVLTSICSFCIADVDKSIKQAFVKAGALSVIIGLGIEGNHEIKMLAIGALNHMCLVTDSAADMIASGALTLIKSLCRYDASKYPVSPPNPQLILEGKEQGLWALYNITDTISLAKSLAAAGVVELLLELGTTINKTESKRCHELVPAALMNLSVDVELQRIMAGHASLGPRWIPHQNDKGLEGIAPMPPQCIHFLLSVMDCTTAEKMANSVAKAVSGSMQTLANLSKYSPNHAILYASGAIRMMTRSAKVIIQYMEKHTMDKRKKMTGEQGPLTTWYPSTFDDCLDAALCFISNMCPKYSVAIADDSIGSDTWFILMNWPCFSSQQCNPLWNNRPYSRDYCFDAIAKLLEIPEQRALMVTEVCSVVVYLLVEELHIHGTLTSKLSALKGINSFIYKIGSKMFDLDSKWDSSISNTKWYTEKVEKWQLNPEIEFMIDSPIADWKLIPLLEDIYEYGISCDDFIQRSALDQNKMTSELEAYRALVGIYVYFYIKHADKKGKHNGRMPSQSEAKPLNVHVARILEPEAPFQTFMNPNLFNVKGALDAVKAIDSTPWLSIHFVSLFILHTLDEYEKDNREYRVVVDDAGRLVRMVKQSDGSEKKIIFADAFELEKGNTIDTEVGSDKYVNRDVYHKYNICTILNTMLTEGDLVKVLVDIVGGYDIQAQGKEAITLNLSTFTIHVRNKAIYLLQMLVYRAKSAHLAVTPVKGYDYGGQISSVAQDETIVLAAAAINYNNSEMPSILQRLRDLDFISIGLTLLAQISSTTEHAFGTECFKTAIQYVHEQVAVLLCMLCYDSLDMTKEVGKYIQEHFVIMKNVLVPMLDSTVKLVQICAVSILCWGVTDETFGESLQWQEKAVNMIGLTYYDPALETHMLVTLLDYMNASTTSFDESRNFYCTTKVGKNLAELILESNVNRYLFYEKVLPVLNKMSFQSQKYKEIGETGIIYQLCSLTKVQNSIIRINGSRVVSNIAHMDEYRKIAASAGQIQNLVDCIAKKNGETLQEQAACALALRVFTSDVALVEMLISCNAVPVLEAFTNQNGVTMIGKMQAEVALRNLAWRYGYITHFMNRYGSSNPNRYNMINLTPVTDRNCAGQPAEVDLYTNKRININNPLRPLDFAKAGKAAMKGDDSAISIMLNLPIINIMSQYSSDNMKRREVALIATELITRVHDARYYDAFKQMVPKLIAIGMNNTEPTQQLDESTAAVIASCRGHAVIALSHLSYDATSRKIMMNRGAAEMLIRVGKLSSDKVSDAVVTSLHNLCIESEGRKIVTSMGAVQVVIKIGLDAKDMAAKEGVVGALYNMSVEVDVRKQICPPSALQLIVDVGLHGSVDSKESAAGVVLNVSIESSLRKLLADAGCIPMLMAVGQCPSHNARERAAGALCSLSVDEDLRLRMGNMGVIAIMVDIVKCGTIGGREKAATALLNFAHHQHLRKEAFSQCALPALIHMAVYCASEGENMASRALNNLCMDGDIALQVAGEDAGVTLIDLAKTGTDDTRNGICSTFWHLCGDRYIKKQLISEGILPVLVSIATNATSYLGKERACRTFHRIITGSDPSVREYIILASKAGVTDVIIERSNLNQLTEFYQTENLEMLVAFACSVQSSDERHRACSAAIQLLLRIAVLAFTHKYLYNLDDKTITAEQQHVRIAKLGLQMTSHLDNRNSLNLKKNDSLICALIFIATYPNKPSAAVYSKYEALIRLNTGSRAWEAMGEPEPVVEKEVVQLDSDEDDEN